MRGLHWIKGSPDPVGKGERVAGGRSLRRGDGSNKRLATRQTVDPIIIALTFADANSLTGYLWFDLRTITSPTSARQCCSVDI